MIKRITYLWYTCDIRKICKSCNIFFFVNSLLQVLLNYSTTKRFICNKIVLILVRVPSKISIAIYFPIIYYFHNSKKMHFKLSQLLVSTLTTIIVHHIRDRLNKLLPEYFIGYYLLVFAY